jgi:hypothetical protein
MKTSRPTEHAASRHVMSSIQQEMSLDDKRLNYGESKIRPASMKFPDS